jgi:Rrf2 family protein
VLSKKSKYAIKALVVLARNYGKGPLLISKISEEEGIPRKFLEAILLELKRKSILGSKMGAGGGYYLVKHPKEVKLSSVLRLTDGPIALVPCVSLNFYERCEECVDEVTCGLRDVAREVRDASLHILGNTSVEDLLVRESRLDKTVKKALKKTKKKKK